MSIKESFIFWKESIITKQKVLFFRKYYNWTESLDSLKESIIIEQKFFIFLKESIIIKQKVISLNEIIISESLISSKESIVINRKAYFSKRKYYNSNNFGQVWPLPRT